MLGRSRRVIISLIVAFAALAGAGFGPSAQAETIVHAFAGGTDGAEPSGVGLIADKTGNLFGTTAGGGSSGCGGSGCGTVFKVAPDGTETVFYSFAGGADGYNPEGS